MKKLIGFTVISLLMAQMAMAGTGGPAAVLQGQGLAGHGNMSPSIKAKGLNIAVKGCAMDLSYQGKQNDDLSYYSSTAKCLVDVPDGAVITGMTLSRSVSFPADMFDNESYSSVAVCEESFIDPQTWSSGVLDNKKCTWTSLYPSGSTNISFTLPSTKQKTPDNAYYLVIQTSGKKKPDVGNTPIDSLDPWVTGARAYGLPLVEIVKIMFQ